MNELFTIRTAFGIVILSLLLSGFLTSGAILFIQSNSGVTFTGPLTLIFGELFLVLPLFIILTRRTKNIRQAIRMNTVPPSTLGLTAIFSLGVVVWTDEVDRLISSLIPSPKWLPEVLESLRADDLLSLLLLFIGTVLLSAISEEILFRGFLQRIMEYHWKDVTRAVLMTSLFFAIIHFNPSWMIQIYLLAVLMGYLAWKTNSIFPSIVMHGINNCLAFTFLNWGEHLEPLYTWRGHVSPIILSGGAALVVIGFKRLSHLKLNSEKTFITNE